MINAQGEHVLDSQTYSLLVNHVKAGLKAKNLEEAQTALKMIARVTGIGEATT